MKAVTRPKVRVSSMDPDTRRLERIRAFHFTTRHDAVLTLW